MPSQHPHSPFRTVKGLRYASTTTGDLHLDLYVPDCPAPALRPVVLYLHGGGWLTGSRTDHPDRPAGLARRGIAVASADYRFAHEAAYPAQLHDVRQAVRWLRREGPSHGIGNGPIGVWGASAGAHIAALLALTTTDETDPESTVQALVGYFGVYDLTARADSIRPDPSRPIPDELLKTQWPAHLPQPPSPRLRQALLAGTNEENLTEDHLRTLSPVTYAHAASPPTLLLHGTGDAVTSPQQSSRFATAIRSAGGTARSLLLDGANHEDPAFEEPEVIGAVAEFFNDNLCTDLHPGQISVASPHTPRLPRLTEADLDDAQHTLRRAITSGPRSTGPQHFPLQDENGALNGPFGLMLHTPDLGAPLQELGSAIRYRATLNDRTREIAILTVAAATSSEFETYAHERVGRAAGLTEAELTALRTGTFTSTDPSEAAAYAACRRLLLDDTPWSDTEYDATQQLLGNNQLLELTVLVGYYRTLAQLMNVFDVGAP
ncbi:alpha/beta hydrolase fold domain-containing protein [Streptomyces sp. NPDC002795]|uniref:alpha/beta hydrolase fold domain-containing protein n=1 Tax=Streptomyces sp. NPDC002795 TaxID=3364665 RepID=UPI0036CC1DD0